MAEIAPFLFFLILGAALISAELLIFNFSVFWFLFIGIGAVVAALVAWLFPGIGWLYSSLTFVVASTLTSVGLYSPLKRWQQKPSAMPGNDAIGQMVDVIELVEEGKQGTVEWSGTDWSARLASGSEALAVGDQAEIVKINGIVLLVKKT